MKKDSKHTALYVCVTNIQPLFLSATICSLAASDLHLQLSVVMSVLTEGHQVFTYTSTALVITFFTVFILIFLRDVKTH